MGGFAALTYDNDEALSPNLRLFQESGGMAADFVEAIAASAATA